MWVTTVSKIINFGLSWLDTMSMAEENDKVYGENDPGGTPIAITAMNSASAQIYATMQNNLQYIRDIMVFDDVTINVSTVVELQAALDILDRVTFIQRDVTFQISMASGTYAWPNSEARAAIEVWGISGEGRVQFDCANAYIIGEASTIRPLIWARKCECEVLINAITGPILENNKASGDAAARFEDCRYVVVNGLHVLNASGDTLNSAVYCSRVQNMQLDLTVDTPAPTYTGVDVGIHAERNSTVYIGAGNVTLEKLEQSLVKLERGSQLILERFSDLIPSGADMAPLTARLATSIDATSKLKAVTISGSGSGTVASPYVITAAWESATDTVRKVQNLIDSLPQPLDVRVKIKFPAGTLTGGLYLDHLKGKGALILEGNALLVTRGLTQTSIIDANLVTLRASYCDLPIIIHSLKLDCETGGGAVEVVNSREVSVEFCWLRAVTGVGTDNNFGNGVIAEGSASNVYVLETRVGDCNRMGLHAKNGAVITTTNNFEETAGTVRPTIYGQYATESGSVYRSTTATRFITGATAIQAESNGGKVFNS